ncbi:MAG TPA: nuclear transport factor 2 family protein [Candidatus Udaeobacter sp.]|jgi:hypothetical protein|nr:nuclear transport factor 2 family protein [Candidatus Udaeobacter sp.]
MKPVTHQSGVAGTQPKARFSLTLTGVAIALFSILPSTFVCAQTQSQSGAAEGEKMERQMWADFKAKNWAPVESKIAEGFQSIHPDGARDRAGEITLIKNLNLGEYTLSDFKTTVNGDNIVVTYTIAVQETIDQQQLGTKRTSRLSVWKKGTHGWQWICHANLNPIP